MTQRNATQIELPIRGIHPVEILGPGHRLLKVFKKRFPDVTLKERGGTVVAIGAREELEELKKHWQRIVHYIKKHGDIDKRQLRQLLNIPIDEPIANGEDVILYGVDGTPIKARTPTQKKMVEAVEKNRVVFAIGPAGTGKTYLAVVLAVRALKNKAIKRIILTRPAVEAGEKLGFLPGDLKEKVDPYLRPLYDALHDLMPHATVQQLIDEGLIEIAPLAFMRGRTLDKAFVILDEAQNASLSQLKMFLTRLGPQGHFIITGDVTQIDLPRPSHSGLREAIKILRALDNVAVIEYTKEDVMRHPMVEEIIQAFDRYEATKEAANASDGDHLPE